MRGLLIALCALVTSAAALAGGCGFLFAGLVAASARNQVDATNRGEAAIVMAIGVAAVAVTAAVVVVNLALIAALGRGRAPRRSGWFVLLAAVDFVIAACLVAVRVAWPGSLLAEPVPSLVLPAGLAVKGLLTLLLPAQPPRLPPRADGRTSRTGS